MKLQSVGMAAVTLGLAVLMLPARAAAQRMGGVSAFSGRFDYQDQLRPETRTCRLTIVGRVPAEQTLRGAEGPVIVLQVNGERIPMRIQNQEASSDLQFDSDVPCVRELYSAVKVKRVEVVGDPALRQAIITAASEGREIQIEGSAFDRWRPYLAVGTITEIK
ncbi:MAG TPA: hypothetical protein VEJ86_05285 [Candidatus Binataceae bacterium]|nr:hypothetical protein [Candidatus Binataceae bacterium]